MLSDHLFEYWAVFGVSAAIVILLTPLFIKLAPLAGLMDVPDERCIHKKITPLGGGVIVFIGFNVACYSLYHYFWPDFTGHLDIGWWQAFLISSAILLIVGLVDDIAGMPPLNKLAGQALATVCLYLISGHQLNLLGFDFGFWGGMAFVLIWTLGIVNAFNLIDGLDGLCSGLAMISSAGLAAVFMFRGVPGDAMICLALAGGCVGFLRYNFFPAKVFLGDTGSMFLGFALASISLHAGGKGSFFVILAAPFFIAGIPIIDTLLAIWRRSIRKVLAHRDGNPGVKIMQPDKEHLHHRLLDYGLKQHHVALVLYAVNMLIVGLGLFFIIAQEAANGLLFIILITAVYLLVKYVLQIELWETSKLLARPNDKPRVTRFKLIFYPLFDLLWMSLSVWLAGMIVLSGKQPFHGIGDWAFQVFLWVMPVLSSLLMSKVYIKIWRNSVFRDYLSLMLAVLVGCSISWALVCLLTGNAGIATFNQLLLFCLFSLIGVIGIRTPHQVIREWCAVNHRHNKRNVLIYGAGTHGGLYVRERHLNHSVDPDSVNVVGFIDDNSLLRQKYVYGKAVLGQLSDFNELVSKHHIDEVILTTAISTDNLSKLKQIAEQHKIKLMEWRAYTVGVH